MATDVQILTGATPGHVLELAGRMRQEDLAEILASGFDSARDVLEQSLAASDLAFTALFNGEVAVIFGVAPKRLDGMLGRCLEGEAWALTSDTVSRHPMTFFRLCKPALEVLLEHCPCLVNWIDARYVAALRWAKYLGFSVGDPQPHGPSGQPFCFISQRRI